MARYRSDIPPLPPTTTTAPLLLEDLLAMTGPTARWRPSREPPTSTGDLGDGRRIPAILAKKRTPARGLVAKLSGGRHRESCFGHGWTRPLRILHHRAMRVPVILATVLL